MVTDHLVDLKAFAVQWFAGGQPHSEIALVHERITPPAPARPAAAAPGARSLDDQVRYLTRKP